MILVELGLNNWNKPGAKLAPPGRILYMTKSNMADIGEINATKTQHNDFEQTPISKYRTLGLYMRSYLHLVFTYMCMVPCEILFFYRVSRHFEFDSYKILPKGANFAPG